VLKTPFDRDYQSFQRPPQQAAPLRSMLLKRMVIALVGGLFLLCCATGYGIRVASWNLGNFGNFHRWYRDEFRPNYPKGHVSWSGIIRTIETLKPDVLLLQEVQSTHELRFLQNALLHAGHPMPYHHFLETRKEGRNLAALWIDPKLHAHPAEAITYPYNNGEFTLLRGIIALQYPGPKPLTMINIHLKSRYTNYPDDPESREWRASEWMAILRYIGKQHWGKDPIIIGGDFNGDPLQENWHLPSQWRKIPLHPWIAPEGSCWFSKEKRWTALDHFLVNPGFDDTQSATKAWLAPETSPPQYSDHRLLWFDFVPREILNGSRVAYHPSAKGNHLPATKQSFRNRLVRARSLLRHYLRFLRILSGSTPTAEN